MDVPEFDGTSNNPDKYIKWEDNLKRCFDLKDTPNKHKYKLKKVKLTKLETTWFEGI